MNRNLKVLGALAGLDDDVEVERTEGTMPGQFLQWDGESWELVMPRVGCTLPEACNYDPTEHDLHI